MTPLGSEIDRLRQENEALKVERDAALAEAGELRTALLGADWIIKKLAPHEAMNIQIRGYRPADDDIATGAKYREMIDTALSSTPLAAQRMEVEAANDRVVELAGEIDLSIQAAQQAFDDARLRYIEVQIDKRDAVALRTALDKLKEAQG